MLYRNILCIDNVVTWVYYRNMNTSTLQIRIDPKTKVAAQKAFKTMGMDMSSGVKIFLTQVAKDECFPFVPSTKKTIAIRKEAEKQISDFKKGKGKGYTSVKEMFDDLEKGI